MPGLGGFPGSLQIYKQQPLRVVRSCFSLGVEGSGLRGSGSMLAVNRVRALACTA